MRSSLELRLERADPGSPVGLHPLGLRRVGEAQMLDGCGALRLALRREGDVDAARAVAPVEAGRTRRQYRPLAQLAVRQPALAQVVVDERRVQAADRDRDRLGGGDREAVVVLADGAQTTGALVAR